MHAVTQALTGVGNAGRGAGESSLDASRIVYDLREECASFYGAASPSCIAFTGNSTEALNTVIRGAIPDNSHVITTVMEHNSVLRPLFRLEKENGVRLTILGIRESGKISMEELEAAICEDTAAVVLTHASNLTGCVNDIAAAGEICSRHGIRLIVDASQTAGVYPIDVEAMHIGALCFTGHKSLMGPQGTGGIVLGSTLMTDDGKALVAPLKVGGSGIHTFDPVHPREMPTALEAGTLNVHGLAGLLAGIRFIKETGIDVIREREESLAAAFYRGICSLPDMRFYGNYDAFLAGNEEPHAPIVSCNIGDYDSARVGDALYAQFGIETRCGGHCAPLLHEAYGTKEQGQVRFSFSWFNTEEDVNAAVNAMRELCG